MLRREIIYNVHSDPNITDEIHTFDVAIKFTRTQLEKMLRAVDGEDDAANTQVGGSEPQKAAMAIAVKKAADLIEITRRRSRLVSAANLFADPAWFILLDLFVRQHAGLQTSVSSACHASFSPVTTALRHIAILTDRNIIQRQYDSTDQRRVFLELTEETTAEIQRVLLTEDYRDIGIAARVPFMHFLYGLSLQFSHYSHAGYNRISPERPHNQYTGLLIDRQLQGCFAFANQHSQMMTKLSGQSSAL